MKKPALANFHFPNFLLIFTDQRRNNFFLLVGASIISFFLFLLVINAARELSATLQKKETKDARKNAVLQKITFWQGVVNKYFQYPDGYMALAVLEYGIGNDNDAILYAQKAVALNPNSNDAKAIEKMVENKSTN